MKASRKSSVKKLSVKQEVRSGVAHVEQIVFKSRFSCHDKACRFVLNRRVLCKGVAVLYNTYVDEVINLEDELMYSHLTVAELFIALNELVSVINLPN